MLRPLQKRLHRIFPSSAYSERGPQTGQFVIPPCFRHYAVAIPTRDMGHAGGVDGNLRTRSIRGKDSVCAMRFGLRVPFASNCQTIEALVHLEPTVLI